MQVGGVGWRQKSPLGTRLAPTKPWLCMLGHSSSDGSDGWKAFLWRWESGENRQQVSIEPETRVATQESCSRQTLPGIPINAQG